MAIQKVLLVSTTRQALRRIIDFLREVQWWSPVQIKILLPRRKPVQIFFGLPPTPSELAGRLEEERISLDKVRTLEVNTMEVSAEYQPTQRKLTISLPLEYLPWLAKRRLSTKF